MSREDFILSLHQVSDFTIAFDPDADAILITKDQDGLMIPRDQFRSVLSKMQELETMMWLIGIGGD